MLDPRMRFSEGVTVRTGNHQFTFRRSQVTEVENELKVIAEKNYDIGAVSDQMKRMVLSIFGDQDFSTSGYWMRAQQIVAKFNADTGKR